MHWQDADGLDLDTHGILAEDTRAARSKHFLGVPVPAATMATANLAHVVAMVEFVAAEIAELPGNKPIALADELTREEETREPRQALARIAG